MSTEAAEELTEQARREAELLQRLEAAGALAHFTTPAGTPPKDWKPLVMPGEPFSQELIRLRGEKG